MAFDEEALLEEAREVTGLSEFGPEEFREGLRALIATYDSGAFTEKGRRRGRRRLVQLLSTRLKIEEAFRKHPEVRAREIRLPVIMTGLPRSGTSALFSLLANDPASRPLRLWETQFPEPLEDREPGQADPRRDAVEAHFSRMREKNPDFTKIHFTSADTPEECVLLHAYALEGVHLGFEVMLEPYASWYRKRDLRPMYAYYRDLLRLLDWQRPGTRWLLKAPAHMWGIDVVVETFPDVSIVWNHRDPLLCVASICSMTSMLMTDQVQVNKRELGPVVMDFYATSLERGLAARDRCDPGFVVDVTHDEFVADPLAVVERIYRSFGVALGSAARSSMEAHVERNPKDKHGTHHYELEEYGLSRDDVQRRFASYIDRFGIESP